MTVELQPLIVKANVIADTQIVKPKLSTAIRVGGDVPPYNGDYTVTPTEETQVLETNGKRMTDNVTVEAVPSDFVGSAIERRSSADLAASGKTVSAPSGYYEESASKDVEDGSVVLPPKAITSNPTISVGDDGKVTANVSKSDTIRAEVTPGYVESVSDGSVSVSGSATEQLDTQSGQTITPSESQQTACAANKYTTGPILVAPIPSAYIIPTGTKQISANGTGIDVASYESVDVSVPTSQPLGTIAQRYDATLVKTWKADRRVVADDHVTLPSYSTNAQTLIAAQTLEAGETDPASGYSYFLAYRGVIYPIYNTNVPVQGRQEYTIMVYSAEQIYNPANTFPSINGSGIYVATAPTATLVTNGQHARHIYWNSSTNMSIYNAGTYGATLSFSAPTVATESITPSSPTIGVRGQNTYMKQSVYETITDIRYQWIIEMWRVPRPNIGLDGFFCNNVDVKVANDLAGNTHTIT